MERLPTKELHSEWRDCYYVSVRCVKKERHQEPEYDETLHSDLILSLCFLLQVIGSSAKVKSETFLVILHERFLYIFVFLVGSQWCHTFLLLCTNREFSNGSNKVWRMFVPIKSDTPAHVIEFMLLIHRNSHNLQLFILLATNCNH